VTSADTARHNAAAMLAREVSATRDELDRLRTEMDGALARATTARDLYFGAAEKLRRLDSSLAAVLQDLPVEERLPIMRAAGLGRLA
jgi:hypothetical protein